MSGMDDVFGQQPHRPAHPDLWRLSQVMLALDGALEAAEDRDAAWEEIMGREVDLASVTYLALQPSDALSRGGDGRRDATAAGAPGAPHDDVAGRVRRGGALPARVPARERLM